MLEDIKDKASFTYIYVMLKIIALVNTEAINNIIYCISKQYMSVILL